jgi:hypothetical protein
MALSFPSAPERYVTEELPSRVKKFLIRSNTADVLEVNGSGITQAATRYIEVPVMEKTHFEQQMKRTNGKINDGILNNADLPCCLDIAKVGDKYEMFVRVQTPADAGGSTEERDNDAMHLWKLNYKALRAIAGAFATDVYDKSNLSDDDSNRLGSYFELVLAAPEKSEPADAPFRINVAMTSSLHYSTGLTVVPDCNLRGVQMSAKNMKRAAEELRAVEESEQRAKQARLELADRMVSVTPLPNGKYVVVTKMRDQIVTTDTDGNTTIIGNASGMA